jgi:hypothetical protein
MLLKMLNGMPGFRPVSIASPIRWAVSFTASDTFSMAGFGSGAALNGGGGVSSLMAESPVIAANLSDGESFRAQLVATS